MHHPPIEGQGMKEQHCNLFDSSLFHSTILLYCQRQQGNLCCKEEVGLHCDDFMKGSPACLHYVCFSVWTCLQSSPSLHKADLQDLQLIPPHTTPCNSLQVDIYSKLELQGETSTDSV
jgi:hypothetical protein